MAKIKNIISMMFRQFCIKLEKTFDPVHYAERVLKEAYPEAINMDGSIDIPKVLNILEEQTTQMDALIRKNNQILDRLKIELSSSIYLNVKKLSIN
jgi:hypothetical protein